MRENVMLRRCNACFLVVLLISCVFLGGCFLSTAREEDPVSWKFAVISDTQGDNRETPGKSCINDAVVTKIAEDMANEKPDFLLVVGDLVNGWFRNGGTAYSTQYAN